MMIPLFSVFSPSSPLQHVQFAKLYNIEKLLHYFGKLLTTFCDKNYSEYHILSLNYSFHLPQFSCASFLPPPKNIKVDPIIRIILVPPLSSVKLSRDVVRENGGCLSPLSQKPIPLEPPNEMTLSTGVYGEPPV